MRPEIRGPRAMPGGFAVGGVLLLLALLSILGVSMARVFISGQESSALDAMGARAEQAALAGVAYGRYQSGELGVCSDARLRFPGLEDYAVSLSCSRWATVEDGAEVRADAWRVVACNRSSCPAVEAQEGYVERSRTVVVVIRASGLSRSP